MATRNEERHIERCLRSILEGTLPESDYEILVVDGQSRDRTHEIVQDLMRDHPQIRWIDNPRRITPVAFNLGLKAARGTHISILSAHCFVERDYYRACFETLDQTGAAVAGGSEIALLANDSAQARLVTAALSSPFGIGGSFRTVSKDGPVDAITAAVFRRSAFEQVAVGVRRKTPLALLLPWVFPALHVTYGLGTLTGVFRFGLTRLARTPPEPLPPLSAGTS